MNAASAAAGFCVVAFAVFAARRLLTYLKRSDLASYRALIEQLGLRH